MNKAGFNERKLEILMLVKDGLQTSREVADTCGISLSCASALLSRYWRQSLLRRYTDTQFNLKIYSLSARAWSQLKKYLDDFKAGKSGSAPGARVV